MLPRWRRILGWASAAAVLGVGGVVAHRFYTHATPERALAAEHTPSTGVVQSVPFAQGRLVISETPHGHGFYGWYLTRNFWGWHVGTTSSVSLGLNPSESPVDWAAISADGKTLLWGVSERPMKSVVYHQGRRSFSASIGTAGLWHVQVPGSVGVVYTRQWSMNLKNGKTVPMYPHA
ncbi:hypothetical protein [Sulfobacillus harzensis]|uniref:Uncharacterized protein n=1 Tax=Sulfobacillus harzensis TaxID=2729629 RepID=A0A7Y0Q4P8_9FIRM|nr:hypothetical protein [Sulfobacillus harzensis]NMP24635.1 hypothetical protein [Sulfobacillus harzensis]